MNKTLNNKIPELLVPAGNLNILKYAVNYGADAVYLGGDEFNLRAFADNFSIEEMHEAVNYCHLNNVKAYITINSIIFESEIKDLERYIKKIKNINFDGYIISDAMIIDILRDNISNPKLHLSTQANVTNHRLVNLYANLGIRRINLAREIRYDDLKKITRLSKAETEVFIHGALCISYSGRCLLSKYMSGRDSNKGACSHSCRWNYYIMEETRSNLFFNITAEKKGVHIFNSRDLCLLPKLDKICKTGVNAVKIEGRMKTESYISQTVWVYRKALDSIRQNSFDASMKNKLMTELYKISHRNYTVGFMFLDDFRELENNEDVKYIKNYRFAGIASKDKYFEGKRCIEVKNQFKVLETIEVLEPFKMPRKFKLQNKILVIKNNAAYESDVANPNDIIVLRDIDDISLYSILRIKENNFVKK